MRKFYLLSLLLLTGCEQSVLNQGYDIETADFNNIKPGLDDMTTVFQKLGSPTVRSSVRHENGEFCWYYAAKQLKKFGFMNPKVTSQKTYVITFMLNGKVKSVTSSSYEQVVHTVSETTKVGGKNKGVLKETFGGLGKYTQRYDKK